MWKRKRKKAAETVQIKKRSLAIASAAVISGAVVTAIAGYVALRWTRDATAELLVLAYDRGVIDGMSHCAIYVSEEKTK